MAAQLCDIDRILLIWKWTHLLVTLASVAFLVSFILCSTDQKIEFKDLGGCRLSSSSSSSGEEKGYAGGEEKGQWLVLRRKFMCKNQDIIFFLQLIKLFHQLFVVVQLKIVRLILKVNTSFPKWNFICNRINTGKHFCSFILRAQIPMPFLW